MLPLMSDLTGANAVGPNTSKKKTIVFYFSYTLFSLI